MLEDRPPQTAELCIGDVLSAHRGKQDYGKTVAVEHSVLNLEQSVTRSLFSANVVNEVSARLGGRLGVPKGPAVSAETKALVRETIRNEFEDSQTLQEIVTHKSTLTFTVSHKLDAKATYVRAAVYQRRRVDVYLAYCDFLDVEYERTTLGLRKKRIKIPPYDPKNRIRSNELYLNEPLGSIQYWKFLPDSEYMEVESKYQCEVKDPLEMRILKVERPHAYPIRFPRIPSLYQIANVAFPLRWIDRKGEWTEGDLLALEWEEAKNTAWWFKYGPGRSKSHKSA
jgi:hypothetical protein